jgi:hypothetical protein
MAAADGTKPEKRVVSVLPIHVRRHRLGAATSWVFSR